MEHPNRKEENMNFETISLLLNWTELGVLLAILFRLARTFDLIANTQRELRRAIHHLSERHAAELGINDAIGGSGSRWLPTRRSSEPELRCRDRSVISLRDFYGRPPVAFRMPKHLDGAAFLT